jgi:uncharacterized protein (UPF0210 family)
MKKNLLFTVVLSGLLTIHVLAQDQAGAKKPLFRIRTVTAGVNLKSVADFATIESAVAFLTRAKKRFEAAGYQVQTLRIATQPLSEYLNGRTRNDALSELKKLDQILSKKNILLSIGPIITKDTYDPEFAPWAVQLVQQTNKINFSVTVASVSRGVHHQTILTAAEAMVAISKGTAGGEGNFRFTASAYCPPNIPFFPAAYHKGEDNFAIGLESPRLLQAAFRGSDGVENAKMKLKALMESKLAAVEALAVNIAREEKREYSGIDVSPAPGLDASIGAAIETLTQVPFGDALTLAGSAAITDVLKNLNIKTCGYSGLMLPVLEDPVLATRAAEGKFSVHELLLYSSVSGTGLDVIPLPGDIPASSLSRLISDMAALSVKLRKPLSARLFPIPGKKAGDRVNFDNPFLTESVVMKID